MVAVAVGQGREDTGGRPSEPGASAGEQGVRRGARADGAVACTRGNRARGAAVRSPRPARPPLLRCPAAAAAAAAGGEDSLRDQLERDGWREPVDEAARRY